MGSRKKKVKKKGNVKGGCRKCSKPVNAVRHDYIHDPDGWYHYSCYPYDWKRLWETEYEVVGYTEASLCYEVFGLVESYASVAQLVRAVDS